MNNDIELRIKKLISDKIGFDESQIKMDSRLSEDLRMDSLDSIDIIMDVEEEFGIEIKELDSENIKTFGDLVNFVQKATTKAA